MTINAVTFVVNFCLAISILFFRPPIMPKKKQDIGKQRRRTKHTRVYMINKANDRSGSGVVATPVRDTRNGRMLFSFAFTLLQPHWVGRNLDAKRSGFWPCRIPILILLVVSCPFPFDQFFAH